MTLFKEKELPNQEPSKRELKSGWKQKYSKFPEWLAPETAQIPGQKLGKLAGVRKHRCRPDLGK